MKSFVIDIDQNLYYTTVIRVPRRPPLELPVSTPESFFSFRSCFSTNTYRLT